LAVPPLVPRIPAPKYYAVKDLSLRKIAPYAANSRPIHNAETNVRIVLDADDKRIWQAERNAFLIVPERSAALRCSSRILADEVKNPPILDVERQLIRQHQAVGGGRSRISRRSAARSGCRGPWQHEEAQAQQGADGCSPSQFNSCRSATASQRSHPRARGALFRKVF
jgi:hypothetical protein